MAGDPNPGRFSNLNRRSLGIAGGLLAIVVVVGAIVLINNRPKAVPRPSTPVVLAQTPGAQATAGGNLAGTATALPPAQAATAIAATGTAAAGTAAPGTAAVGTAAPGTAAPGTAAPGTAAPETAAPGTAAPQEGVVPAAPGEGQSPLAPPVAPGVTPAEIQPGAATQPVTATRAVTTGPTAIIQTTPSDVNSTPGAAETAAPGSTPVAGTTLTPAALVTETIPATPENAQAAAVPTAVPAAPAAATPVAALAAATSAGARSPVRLGNLSVVPPVFVPEAEFPVSVPGAPALGSLAGSAPPGSVISIFDGNTLLGQVQAGADGQWRFPVPSTLSPGRHVLTAVFSAAGAAAGARPLMIVLSAPVIVSAAGEARPAFEAARALAGNAPLLPTSGVDLAGQLAPGWDGPWTGLR
jgi:hypothetical protein